MRVVIPFPAVIPSEARNDVLGWLFSAYPAAAIHGLN